MNPVDKVKLFEHFKLRFEFLTNCTIEIYIIYFNKFVYNALFTKLTVEKLGHFHIQTTLSGFVSPESR
mgnify:CR=1 FL=1